MLSIPTRIRLLPTELQSSHSHAQPVVNNEVRDLLKKLTESISPEKGTFLGALRQQGLDLRRLRQILIEDTPFTSAKEAFRKVGGYVGILEILESLKATYKIDVLGRDERIEFFEVVHGVLDVLSESLNNNSVNRRHFSTRTRSGGWAALENALVETGVADEAFLDNSSAHDALELLFGLLVAFGIAEETTRNLFRGIRKVTEDIDFVEDHEKAESALVGFVDGKLDGSEILQNPEIVPIILRFWTIVLSVCKSENRPAAILWAVPIVLEKIQRASLRNEVAMHNSQCLRPLLALYFREIPFPGLRNRLQYILELLLKFGINTLDDAYLLFRNASKTENATGLILHAMVASRMPPFIQFDLSLHGHSSIELATLGRSFPPTSSSNGYSILTWLKFDELDSGLHTTIFGAHDKSETCFLALFVEKDNHQLVLQTSIKSAQKSSIQFRSFTFQKGIWYHVGVIHKMARRTSPARASLYINGCLMEQVKCQYPSSPPVRSSSSESFASITGSFQQHESVHAFLGTPQALARRQGRNMVKTKWSMAYFYLLQDAVPDDLVHVIHAVGPRYVGNLQDSLGLFQTYRASAEVNVKNENMYPKDPEGSQLRMALTNPACSAIPESKILISFSPTAVLDNQDDNFINESRLMRALSKDAASTLRHTVQKHGSSIIINSAVSSYNDAMTSSHGIGILTGEPVVAVPYALDDACWRIGGSAPVVLKLLDFSRTKDQVLRAVHIIFQSLEGSWRNSEVMEREHAYGVLAGLIREKLGFGSIFTDSSSSSNRVALAVDPSEREELALELLRMILAFVGYSEVEPENALLINSLAYRFLLVDFDTWRRAPIATQKLYYGQFSHYTAKGKHHRFNSRRLIRMRIVKRFIEALKGERFSADVFPDFLEAFSSVFRCSISSETLRMIPLFITYAFQEDRAVPARPQSSRQSLNVYTSGGSNESRPQSSQGKRQRSYSRPSPFTMSATPSNEVSRSEVGIQMLDLLTELLCEPGTDIINKFAKTVTNKWLLHLLAERSDPRIIVLATKMLARILVVHGAPYVKAFADRNGGFSVLKTRLREWWSIPAVWISLFSILFAVDPASIHYSEDFNEVTLGEAFSKSAGKVVYPEVLPVIAAMLESGLKSVVNEGQQSATEKTSRGSSSSLNVDAVRGYSNNEVTNNAEVISAVVRFFGDMHLNWPNFRDFAITSNLVQELLFVIYPVVVTAENVSAETELNSRGSALTFEGQDVQIGSGTQQAKRMPIIRTNTLPKETTPSFPRGAPFRRPSSFILVSTSTPESTPHPAKFYPTLMPSSTEPIYLRVGSSIVTTLVKVVNGIFLDQILNRKEFPGFGIFFKVPPGFQEHQAYFESYILADTMKELANTFRMQEQSLIEGRIISNIARYVNYMAEAIFEGWFMDSSGILLDFIGQRLEFLNRKNERNNKTIRLCRPAIQSMKKTFMRIALLRLSELEDSTTASETIEFLREMMYWQSVIITDEDEDPYFLRLLFFQLYFRIINEDQSIRAAAIEFWRILIVQKSEESFIILENAAPQRQRYLANGFCKLAELENEAFLVWLDHNRSELNSLFFDSLNKYWEEFVADENKKVEESSKIRLGRRRDRLKQWVDDDRIADNHWRKHEGATNHWRNNVFSSERIRYQRSVQDQQDSLGFMALTLEKYDRILKAPCNLYEEEPLVKWRLDETEGVNRTRLRIVQDRQSNGIDYQPKRKRTQSPSRTRSRAVSSATQDTKVNFQPLGVIVQEPESVDEVRRQRSSSASLQSISAADEEFEIIEDPRNPEGEFEDKNRKVMRTLESGDIIQHVYNISRIDGLEAVEGLLIVGKTCMYIIDHYFQRSDGEVVSVWQASIDERDQYVKLISGKKMDLKRPRMAAGDKSTRHWKWIDVMLISKRRFLQRDVAIEVFFTDGRSYLLTAMSVDMRNELHSKLAARSPLINNSIERLNPEDQWRIESLRNLEDQPQSLGLKLASVFNSTSANLATRKWMKGEISNFAYLMQINTMAGRSFNDLTQYPVFPWVLSDYTSKEIDLTNPHSFRDLSKPMGCQSPLRESRFREKYSNIQEMNDEPPYHYGTHYSSSMTVCQYLMRLQPFVKSYLILQGDSFDHADRLFFSIGQAWISASQDPSNDVRELTPEFYYLPEFLININGYQFGQRQSSGETVDNVTLPPWAHGDPHIFIQKHREALESPYVTANLHKWIDLIFGFKQQGEAAIESTNVFHHWSYQSNDLDNVKDTHKVEIAISWIHNFGQTPQQIFTKPHPSRDENASRRDLNKIISHILRHPTPIIEMRNRISTLTMTPNREKPVASGPFQLPVPPNFDIVFRWGFSDGSVRFFQGSQSSTSSLLEAKKPLTLYENFHIGPPSTAVFVDSRTLITAGVDSVISVWNVNASGSKAPEVAQRESLFGHRTAITILAASKSLATLLSADTSGRVLLWDLNRCEFVRELQSADNPGGEVSAAKISPATGEIVLATGRNVRLFALNGALLLERDVCEDPNDYVTACAWYDGVRGEWVRRVLLFTGHRNGVVRVWAKTVVDGQWTLELVRLLASHEDWRKQQSHGHVPPTKQLDGAITCILPTTKGVFTGDEYGRVYQWSVD